MPDLQQQRKGILAACMSGDVPMLKTLFHELDIGPDQPKQEWDFDKTLPQEQRTPAVNSMLTAAIQYQQLDALYFLYSCFPGTSLNQRPIGTAIETGNVEFVRAVCRLDPAAANGEFGHANVLAYACPRPENADIVQVLLASGADPTKEAQHTPPFSNASYAVSGGLPVSTLEQLFDAVYQCNDGWAVRWAVRYKRPDFLELLFERGQQLPTAWFPPREELMELAAENKDADMMALIKRTYPRRRKSLLVTMLGRLRS